MIFTTFLFSKVFKTISEKIYFQLISEFSVYFHNKGEVLTSIDFNRLHISTLTDEYIDFDFLYGHTNIKFKYNVVTLLLYLN